MAACSAVQPARVSYPPAARSASLDRSCPEQTPTPTRAAPLTTTAPPRKRSHRSTITIWPAVRPARAYSPPTALSAWLDHFLQEPTPTPSRAALLTLTAPRKLSRLSPSTTF